MLLLRRSAAAAESDSESVSVPESDSAPESDSVPDSVPDSDSVPGPDAVAGWARAGFGVAAGEAAEQRGDHDMVSAPVSEPPEHGRGQQAPGCQQDDSDQQLCEQTTHGLGDTQERCHVFITFRGGELSGAVGPRNDIRVARATNRGTTRTGMHCSLCHQVQHRPPQATRRFPPRPTQVERQSSHMPYSSCLWLTSLKP